jgi:hypothetical protein
MGTKKGSESVPATCMRRCLTAHGWTYGPAKNWETKQHPVLIPWHLPPLRHQARFKLWQTIVMTLMLETPDYSAIHYPVRS